MSALATVVIVNYNGAHLLGPCLDALEAQRSPQAPFETVVVDNASVDDSRDLLAAKYPHVRVIASTTNTGFAGGNNLALREVRTPYAVLLNNDAAPQPGWLANLLAPFRADPDARLGVVTGKVLFLPRFVRLTLSTEGFRPGPHDGRSLGIRVLRVEVDGTDVTAKVMWESAAYGPEEVGGQTFRWTRPSGEILVPVALERTAHGALREQVRIRVIGAAESAKAVTIATTQAQVGTEPTAIEVVLPAGTPALDVVNNAGGIVFGDGYGADRGFQQVDAGQFDDPQEVFTACGNGMAIRTDVGHAVGWFDDDFFMYYEDTDLSWRIRARGYAIRYEPSAVLRHVHAASSKEWSPRFVFHVDRNRLLMLTKNASAGLAWRAVLRYPASAASMALRAGLEGLRVRHRPAVRPHLLRMRILASYLRLLPRMMRHRRAETRNARLSRTQLETWLTERR